MARWTLASATLALAGISQIMLPIGQGLAADQSSESQLLKPGAAPPSTPAPTGGRPGAMSNALGPPPAATPPKASDKPPPEKPGNPAAAAVGSGYRFQICNRSSTGALATTYHGQGSGWLIKGWYRVDPGECTTVGTFPYGWVYYYADAGDGGSWSGSAVKLCAGYPGPFERYDSGGEYTCQNGEELRNFAGRFVDTNVGTYTWTLNQ